MSRSFNFNSDPFRFLANRPSRYEPAAARRSALRIAEASRTKRSSRIDADIAGGTSGLDALMVAFVLRQGAIVTIAEVAVHLSYDAGRAERAIEILLADGTIVREPGPLAPHSLLRLS